MTAVRTATTARFAAFAFAAVISLSLFSGVAGLSAPQHGAAMLAQVAATGAAHG